jgi:CMD domain protein
MSTLTEPQAEDPAPDFVARLAGLAPDGAVAALRAFRGDTIRYTQGSLDALFSNDVAGLTLRERGLTAWYAALLSRSEQAAHAYRERLLADDVDPVAAARLLDAITRHRGATASVALADADTRLAAILVHTELLVLQPVAARRTHLATLQAAGFTTTAIVALSQLVAFVTYQGRVVAALRALEATA